MRAVIYCRVSTTEQAQNLSLPTQEKACRDFCARQGYDVAEVFVDAGESAKTTNRPEFLRLLAACTRSSCTPSPGSRGTRPTTTRSSRCCAASASRCDRADGAEDYRRCRCANAQPDPDFR